MKIKKGLKKLQKQMQKQMPDYHILVFNSEEDSNIFRLLK